MQIEVVTLVNLKAHPKGSTIRVSAADLAKFPGYYKAKGEVELDALRASGEVRELPADAHRRIKAELTAERERGNQVQAEARAKLLEADAKLAKEGADRATAAAEAGEKSRQLVESEAEVARLKKLLEAKERLDAKVIELRPGTTDPKPEQAPSAPPEAPADKKPEPHLRKRD